MMAFRAEISIKGYAGLQYPALTGGGGFDQCPAPFAGPMPPRTLQIVQAPPDKPLTPQY